MTVFAIMAKEASAALESAIDKNYHGKNYRHSSNIWLVSSNETSRKISENIGVVKGGITGVVIVPIANSYYGVANTALWEWLKAAIESDGND